MIGKIIWWRTQDRKAGLGTWLLDHSNSIMPGIFADSRLRTFSLEELYVLRSVAPLAAITDPRRLSGLPLNLFERYDRDFLAGVEELYRDTMGVMCVLAYRRHIRPPDKAVEEKYGNF